MSSTIIKVDKIVKSFNRLDKEKLSILKSIDLEIEPNKISVIIGASGAGKSTLLHIMGGIDKPDSGEVYYNNEPVFTLNDDKLTRFRNKNIGFVFQFHHLLPEFSAAENVAIPQIIMGVPLKQALKKGSELLDLVGLNHRLSHKPAELSGGEQQRVAIARALANDPQVILADEPTGNLDSANSEMINNLIIDLKKQLNKTFVIVTHNSLMMSLADKVFEIKDGHIKV